MCKGNCHLPRRDVLLVHGLRALASGRRGLAAEDLDVELPPLDVLARVLVRDDDDKLRDLAADHPLVQLRHDLLDVRLDLVVGRNEHVQAILLDGGEVLRGVDASLEPVIVSISSLHRLPSGQSSG